MVHRVNRYERIYRQHRERHPRRSLIYPLERCGPLLGGKQLNFKIHRGFNWESLTRQRYLLPVSSHLER